MKKCRITVVRKARYDDLIEKYEKPKTAMISCNDGFRPVSFYIEALDEDTETGK